MDLHGVAKLSYNIVPAKTLAAEKKRPCAGRTLCLSKVAA